MMFICTPINVYQNKIAKLSHATNEDIRVKFLVYNVTFFMKLGNVVVNSFVHFATVVRSDSEQ